MTSRRREPPDDPGGNEARRQRRSRSRRPGSIQEYQTAQGKRWRFQIYVLKDPEYPEQGMRRLTRSGFKDTAEANDALQDALKQRAQNEKFSGKVPALGVYAEEWAEGLKLADSTVKGYKKIIRNHIKPQLGTIRLDKLTATRIARHYRDLEKHGRADKLGKGQPLSANSVHKIHVVLGAILDAAIEDGHLTVNPTKKRRTVKAPTSSEVRAQKPEIVTWTGEQLHTFLTWNRDELNDELFPLWRLIAYTGMRRSEALAPMERHQHEDHADQHPTCRQYRGLGRDEDDQDRQCPRHRHRCRNAQGARRAQGRSR